MDKATEEKLKKIYLRAQGKTKGRLYIYEAFKQELISLNLTPVEYQDACIKLSRILGI